MLAHRLRRWPNIKSTLAERLVLGVCSYSDHVLGWALGGFSLVRMNPQATICVPHVIKQTTKPRLTLKLTIIDSVNVIQN